MGGAAYPDAQPKGSHLDPKCDIGQYSTDQLTAYWAMVYAIAVIAGIAGTDEEKASARKAVEDALKDAVETTASFGNAAQILVDDYLPTSPVSSGGQRIYQGVARGVEEWFGVKNSERDGRIEELDQQIRDQTAVQVNRAAGIKKTVKGWVGADTSEEERQIAATQKTVDARNAEVGAAFDRIWNGIKDVALSRYNQFVKERNACGVGYALQTLGVDGSFLVVETVVTVAAGAVTGGAGAVALRISVTAGQKAGKIIIKISRAGRAVKHGGPNEGILAVGKGNVEAFGKKHNGYGDDLGSHPNTPAKTEPGGPESGEKKKKSTKAIGDAAETQAKKDLAAKGFTDQKTITNPQGNGVDIIARNPTTGEVMFGEVKGNTATLSTDQAFRGGPDYVRDRLNRVINQSGEWTNATAAQMADAKQALKWLDNNPKFKEIKYDVDPDTGKASNYREKDWNYPPGQRPKDLKWRDGDGKEIPRKKLPKKKPDATGPPAPVSPSPPFGGPR